MRASLHVCAVLCTYITLVSPAELHIERMQHSLHIAILPVLGQCKTIEDCPEHRHSITGSSPILSLIFMTILSVGVRLQNAS